MQSAPFHDLRDEMMGEVNAEMAETVKILFMRNGRDDQSRTNLETIQVLRVRRAKTNNMSGGPSKTLKVGITAEMAQLHINRATYEGPDILSGDVVIALARAGNPRFEVRQVDDRGHNRLTLELTIQ
ncbi:MAG: hypothetical protein P1V21_01230 [Rhizobiaceae bacterium]|nr:hypothetical protein [Rhizobiaceae bacterium]